jgi:hypothetical protein
MGTARHVALAVLVLAGSAAAQFGPGNVAWQAQIAPGVGGFDGLVETDDRLGPVALLGDVNGDGVADLAIGAPGDNETVPHTQQNMGAVWIVFLAEDGTVRGQQKISSLEGGFTGPLNPDAFFGSVVAAPGDVDGDGVPDLAVGAPTVHDGLHPYTSGSVWLLLLRPDGTVRQELRISASTGGFGGQLDHGDAFGSSLAVPGDVDGDGVPDLAVGAKWDDDAAEDAGAAWLLFLNHDASVHAETKISALAGGFPDALAEDDNFGWSLAALGDRDGDGVPDLAVSAPAHDDGGHDRGAVWLLSLHADGSVKASTRISSTQGGFAGPLDDGDWFGSALAAPGDIDGDGVADLAVGAFGDDDGSSSGIPTGPNIDSGAVWLLFLGPDGSVAGQQKLSDVAGGFEADLDDYDSFGASLAALGDLDGNGARDLAVGVPADDGESASAAANFGAVWLLGLQGPPSGSWTDLGHALKGALGKPALLPSGSPAPGELVELRLTGAKQNSPITLVIGLAELGLPFHGGVLVPSPDVLVPSQTNGIGNHSFEGLWSGGVPVLFQCWIADPSAIQGLSASNAVIGTPR